MTLVMRRHLIVIALSLALLLAGCTASVSPSGTTTDGTVTTTSSANCPPPGNFSERALPAPPSTLTRASVTAFVAEYEENLTWNRMVEDDYISLGVHASRPSVVNETETGYIVHVEGTLGFERCIDGGHVAGDGVFSANYFVNGTTLVRLDDPENNTTDPRNNGTVVERWGE